MIFGFQLTDRSGERVIVPQLMIATSFWSRFRGLQFQKTLAQGTGLLIAPARSIHTHWMRFAIDVVMLNEQGVVTQVKEHLPPWRFCNGPAGTKFVLEVAAGKNHLVPGDQIALRSPPEAVVPRLLQRLPIV